ncbi:hypothetical protein NC653_014756 [Populus alba x Populus x berolinensis]|uniref:peroxidase n=1 Tax=Populus alba x Populus x berolinensis TaxID=444605 RepID=A0AAD6QXX7_9ROSI|nr:hypothetical protein NC653_014689 [Populus alba x Populus x berolinensis]KAJ6998682.1 hypothetical protein NC653_014756 [Populus alba x Populus x berolinensis]
MEAERKQDVVSVSAMNGDGLQEFCNSVREKLKSGGSNWELPLGRRDSKTASLSGSNNNIPAPNSTIQNLVPFFKRQGLYEVDLVALSEVTPASSQLRWFPSSIKENVPI